MSSENKTIDFLRFHNPSLGELTFDEMTAETVKFIKDKPNAKYQVMIGSDSKGADELDLVSVVAVHRIGSGGRYFYHRGYLENIHTLREKIYAEVDASLRLASSFLPAFRQKLTSGGADLPFDFQIHVDVGENGKTRDLVHEITGMVTAYGYHVLVKPESAAATTFADRHVR